MSDYMSKQVTMQRFLKEIEQSRSECIHINTIKRLLNDIDTLDEKEIIRKPFERVVERLEQSKDAKCFLASIPEQRLRGSDDAYDDAIEIVIEECGINE